jgi:heme/copper-type cytochrome/quinol oxidase subunit 2
MHIHSLTRLDSPMGPYTPHTTPACKRACLPERMLVVVLVVLVVVVVVIVAVKAVVVVVMARPNPATQPRRQTTCSEYMWHACSFAFLSSKHPAVSCVDCACVESFRRNLKHNTVCICGTFYLWSVFERLNTCAENPTLYKPTGLTAWIARCCVGEYSV